MSKPFKIILVACLFIIVIHLAGCAEIPCNAPSQHPYCPAPDHLPDIV